MSSYSVYLPDLQKIPKSPILKHYLSEWRPPLLKHSKPQSRNKLPLGGSLTPVSLHAMGFCPTLQDWGSQQQTQVYVHKKKKISLSMLEPGVRFTAAIN